MLNPAALRQRDLWRAGLLCAISGYVDAIGYLELGAVFAANMTGNTVLLAINAVHGEWAKVPSYALTLLTFLAGAILATVLRRLFRTPLVPFLLEAATLVLVTLVAFPREAELALLAAAMGIQGASLTRFGGTSLQTVVITGTMIRLADACVERSRFGAGAPIPATDDVLETTALAWIGYGLGAGLGAAALGAARAPLVIVAIVIVLLAAELAWSPWQRRR